MDERPTQTTGNAGQSNKRRVQVMNKELLEDIRSLLRNGPQLYSDILKALRGTYTDGNGTFRTEDNPYSSMKPESGRSWRIREQGLLRDLSDFGFYVRIRKHGSGNAYYLGLSPFSEITDFHGKVHQVLTLYSDRD